MPRSAIARDRGECANYSCLLSGQLARKPLVPSGNFFFGMVICQETAGVLLAISRGTS